MRTSYVTALAVTAAVFGSIYIFDFGGSSTADSSQFRGVKPGDGPFKHGPRGGGNTWE